MNNTILIAFLLLVLLCFVLSLVLLQPTQETYTGITGGGEIKEENLRDDNLIHVENKTCGSSVEMYELANESLHDVNPEEVISTNNTVGGGSGKHANWRRYKDWNELTKDKDAYQAYLDERNKLIENPIIKWDNVMGELKDRLNENREYMLLIDVVDGVARIQQIEASTSDSKTEKSKNIFASISMDLYKKFIKIPALITGHTHPIDNKCDPFPSVSDIYLSASKSAYNRYAGDVVFCRFGAIFYGLEHKLSTDLLANNFPHSVDVYLNDIVMAHQAMRSWTCYSYLDYVSFFRQYRMFFHVYPTPEYVAFQDKKINKRIINHPIDLDLIEFTISVLRKSGKN